MYVEQVIYIYIERERAISELVSLCSEIDVRKREERREERGEREERGVR